MRIVPDVAASGTSANPGLVDGLLGTLVPSRSRGTDAAKSVERPCNSEMGGLFSKLLVGRRIRWNFFFYSIFYLSSMGFGIRIR